MDDQRRDREGCEDGKSPRFDSKRLRASAVLVIAGLLLFVVAIPIRIEYPDSALPTWREAIGPLWFAAGPLIGAGLLNPFEMWAGGALIGFVAEVLLLLFLGTTLAGGLGGG